MRYLLFLTFSIHISMSFSQAGGDKPPTPPPVIGEPGVESRTVSVKNENLKTKDVEQMPMFPGGDSAVAKYIESTIKYPESAKQNKINGRVLVSFNVSKTGQVENVKLVKGIGGGCDEEAIRAVSKMPDWLPGLLNGNPVKVRYVMPVIFRP